MEEFVWSNISSMLPAVVSPFPWSSGTLISPQVPASFSAPLPCIIPEIMSYHGNVDDGCSLGIQLNPDISYSPLIESNAIGASQYPLHTVDQYPGQMIPTMLDKFVADSVLARPRSVTALDYPVTEIPASSSAATNMGSIQSNPQIKKNCMDHTIAYVQEGGFSSFEDKMQFRYSYDQKQLRNQQSSMGSSDCVLYSSDNKTGKADVISPTSTTEHTAIENMKSMVLSPSNPPENSTTSIITSQIERHINSINIIEDYQSASQCSDPIKSKATKFKPKSKSRTKTKTYEDDHINYSSFPSSPSRPLFNEVDLVRIEPDEEAIAKMREKTYWASSLRPVNLCTQLPGKPKRKRVKISSDPQTAAARQRREKIRERIRILQRLVPGGTKMDTASMLDEAVNYLKFLKAQIKAQQSIANNNKVDNSIQINSMQGSCSFTSDSLNSFLFNTALNSHIYQNGMW